MVLVLLLFVRCIRLIVFLLWFEWIVWNRIIFMKVRIMYIGIDVGGINIDVVFMDGICILVGVKYFMILDVISGIV